ncbi:hypothetical protein [Pistricoccus aurantiacus]|uniref:hypothetical protein n=1 Tax=Pistricoccus aurantiacus TaxID=1883414 RepID=UPI003630975D
MSESNRIDTGSLPKDEKEIKKQTEDARQIIDKDKSARDDESKKTDPATHGSGLPPMSDGSAGEASNGPATPGHRAGATRDKATATDAADEKPSKGSADKKFDGAD